MRLFQINHVAVQVSNLPKSIDFYTNVLLLPQINRPNLGFDGAWFQIGLYQEIHLIAGLEATVNSNSRGNHLAFETDSILDAEVHLRKLNYPYRPPKQRPDGAWQIFLKDPDGYVIEIYQK